MEYRFAELADIPVLVEAHAQLQIDLAEARPAHPGELEKRFWTWLGGDHRIVLFERDSRLAAYALYLPKESAIELQQFFVRRDLRPTSAGRDAFRLLRNEVWSGACARPRRSPVGRPGDARFLAFARLSREARALRASCELQLA